MMSKHLFTIDSQPLIEEEENDNIEEQQMQEDFLNSESNTSNSIDDSDDMAIPNSESKESHHGAVGSSGPNKTPSKSKDTDSGKSAEQSTGSNGLHGTLEGVLHTHKTMGDASNTPTQKYGFMNKEDREFCLALEKTHDEEQKKLGLQIKNRLESLMEKRVTIYQGPDKEPIHGIVSHFFIGDDDIIQVAICRDSFVYPEDKGNDVKIPIMSITRIEYIPHPYDEPRRVANAKEKQEEKQKVSETETPRIPSPKILKPPRLQFKKTSEKQTDTGAKSPKKPKTESKQQVRTNKGWQDSTQPQTTYADKARKATKQPLKEITFNWTPMGVSTRRGELNKQLLQKKKDKWVKALHKTISEEIKRAQETSEWPDFDDALKNSFDIMEMYNIDEARKGYHISNDALLSEQKLLDNIWEDAVKAHHANLEKEHQRFTKWKDQLLATIRRIRENRKFNEPMVNNDYVKAIEMVNKLNSIQSPYGELMTKTFTPDMFQENSKEVYQLWTSIHDSIKNFNRRRYQVHDESDRHLWKLHLRGMIDELKKLPGQRHTDLRNIFKDSFMKVKMEMPEEALEQLYITPNIIHHDDQLNTIWTHVQQEIKKLEEKMSPQDKNKKKWLNELPQFIATARREALIEGTKPDYVQAVLDSLHSLYIFIERSDLKQFDISKSSIVSQRDVLNSIWAHANNKWIEMNEFKYLMPDFKDGRDNTPIDEELEKGKLLWIIHLKQCLDYETDLKQAGEGEAPHLHAAVWTALMHMGLYLHPGYLDNFQLKARDVRNNETMQNAIWDLAVKKATRARKHVSHETKYSPPLYILKENWIYFLKKEIEDMWRNRGYDEDFDHLDYAQSIHVSFLDIGWDADYKSCRLSGVTTKEDIWNPVIQDQLWEDCPLVDIDLGPYEKTKVTPRDELMSPDFEEELLNTVPWKYTELPFTREDKIDAIQLNYDYQRTVEQHQLSFRDWMEKSNASNLLRNIGEITAGEPEILTHITRTGHREFFLANWMMDYPSIKMNFETWYDVIGRTLKVPTKMSAKLNLDYGSQEDARRTPPVENYADAGLPPLLVQPIIPEDNYRPDQVIRHCTLQSPPKKAEPTQSRKHPDWIIGSDDESDVSQGGTPNYLIKGEYNPTRTRKYPERIIESDNDSEVSQGGSPTYKTKWGSRAQDREKTPERHQDDMDTSEDPEPESTSRPDHKNGKDIQRSNTIPPTDTITQARYEQVKRERKKWSTEENIFNAITKDILRNPDAMTNQQSTSDHSEVRITTDKKGRLRAMLDDKTFNSLPKNLPKNLRPKARKERTHPMNTRAYTAHVDYGTWTEEMDAEHYKMPLNLTTSRSPSYKQGKTEIGSLKPEPISELDSPSSANTNEPFIMNTDGTPMSKQERKRYYLNRDNDTKEAIRIEMAEPNETSTLSEREYQGIINTLAIKSPPMDRTTWELAAIKGNTILDPRIDYPWIDENHFMPGGILAHIYIPRYVYIPHDVFNKFKMWFKKGTTSYISFWRHLLIAQDKANKSLTKEYLRDTHKTDYRAMLKNKTPKTIITRKVDLIQHRFAHQEAEKIGWVNLTQRNVYDWFIRPVERLFAVDMPQGPLLMRAMTYHNSAQKLFNIITRFTGIPPLANITPIFMVEEMSKIRMSFDIDFQKRAGTDRPAITIPKLKLEPDQAQTYFKKTTDEGNKEQNSPVEEHSKPFHQNEENNTDDDSTYDDEINEWDNIVKEYDQVTKISRRYKNPPDWIRTWLLRAQNRFAIILNKCRMKCRDLHRREAPLMTCVRRTDDLMTFSAPNQTRRKTSTNSSKSRNTDMDSNEPMDTMAQLEEEFEDKLTFPRRIAENMNPTHDLTPEQEQCLKDVIYYSDKAEELHLDLIKCDPNDLEHIDILSRAKDNCYKAKEQALLDLQFLLDKEDREYRQKARQQRKKARKQLKKLKKLNAKQQPQTTPEQTPKNDTRKQKPKRPTALPTAKQIRTQNPWKIQIKKPIRPYGPDTEEELSEESFQRSVSITSTPKRDESPNGPYRSNYTGAPERSNYNPGPYPHISASTRSITPPPNKRTKNRSPSPPRPLTTKWIRKKAPNGDNLYHYKLWSPLNETKPQFSRVPLSAAEAYQHITGTSSNADAVTPTHKILITVHGMHSYRKLVMTPDVIRRRVLISEITQPEQINYGDFDIHEIYVPYEHLSHFMRLLERIHHNILEPLDRDGVRSGTLDTADTKIGDFRAKASVIYNKTSKGSERLVIIQTNTEGESKDTIAIPWILFTKFVEAMQKMQAYCTPKHTDDNIN